MKTPTWAIVVAAIMLLFGGCGVSNHIQKFVYPMADVEREVFRHVDSLDTAKVADTVSTMHISEAGDTSWTTTVTTSGPGFEEDFGRSLKRSMNLSDHTRTWLTRFGYIGLFVSFIYLLGGLFLLVKKPFSIRLAYAALVLSLLSGLTLATLLLQDKQSGLFIHVYGIGKVIGVFIDIVLLIVVATSDKTAYRPATETPYE